MSRGFDNFDLRFIGLIVAILAIGVLSIYSVTHDQGVAFPFYAKQFVWIALGTVAFLSYAGFRIIIGLRGWRILPMRLS